MNDALRDQRLRGLRVVFEASDQGGYTVECLDIPGCVSEGDDYAEAERNIQLAINACLEVLFEDFITALGAVTANPLNSEVSEKVFEVAVPHIVARAA